VSGYQKGAGTESSLHLKCHDNCGSESHSNRIYRTVKIR